MSPVGLAFLSAGLTGFFTVLGIFLSHALTKKRVHEEMNATFNTSLARLEERICGIEIDIDEMKADLKEHNHYAERFGQIEADLAELRGSNNAHFENIFHQLDRLNPAAIKK